MTDQKDAFDLWWEWSAAKHRQNRMTIQDEIYEVVMTLTPEERTDRAIVNEAVRTQSTPLRAAGSEDPFGLPKAEE
jgi:hypothetical protein